MIREWLSLILPNQRGANRELPQSKRQPETRSGFSPTPPLKKIRPAIMKANTGPEN